MEPSTKRFALVPAFALLLAGCGGGGGGGSASCASITGGGSTTRSSGPVENPAAAADGSLSSYANFRPTPTAQSGSVRAIAQDGIVYPAGSQAGAFAAFLNQGSSNSTSLRTYLDGRLVETSSPANLSVDFSEDGHFYISFRTSVPFDAVEFAETDSGSSARAEYRVYELCSDGHV